MTKIKLAAVQNISLKFKVKDLMMIFDGYDEMTKADHQMSDNVFMKLLQGKALLGCHLVVTSRPYITVHLHKYCRCRVE